MRAIAATCAIAAIACGARTPLGVDHGDGGATTSCVNAGVTIVATVTLDTATPAREPEERPSVVWTGSAFLAAWPRWRARDGYEVALAKIATDGTVTPGATFDPGKSFPINVRASWDGATAAVFWTAIDGSIWMRRFDANGSIFDTGRAIIP